MFKLKLRRVYFNFISHTERESTSAMRDRQSTGCFYQALFRRRFPLHNASFHLFADILLRCTAISDIIHHSVQLGDPEKVVGSVDCVLSTRSNASPSIPAVALPSSLLGLANLSAVTLSSEQENERDR